MRGLQVLKNYVNIADNLSAVVIVLLTNIASVPLLPPTETHQDIRNSKVDDVNIGGGLHVFPHQDDHHHQRVTSDADLKHLESASQFI